MKRASGEIQNTFMTARVEGPGGSEWAMDKNQTSVKGSRTTMLIGQPQGVQPAWAPALRFPLML